LFRRSHSHEPPLQTFSTLFALAGLTTQTHWLLRAAYLVVSAAFIALMLTITTTYLRMDSGRVAWPFSTVAMLGLAALLLLLTFPPFFPDMLARVSRNLLRLCELHSTLQPSTAAALASAGTTAAYADAGQGTQRGRVLLSKARKAAVRFWIIGMLAILGAAVYGEHATLS
jgi:hypothetical protein